MQSQSAEPAADSRTTKAEALCSRASSRALPFSHSQLEFGQLRSANHLELVRSVSTNNSSALGDNTAIAASRTPPLVTGREAESLAQMTTCISSGVLSSYVYCSGV